MNSFAQEHPEQAEVIIETTIDGITTWIGTVWQGTAYLIGDAPDKNCSLSKALTPFHWRRGKGRSPREALQHILEHDVPHQDNPYQALPHFVVTLPSTYEIHPTLTEQSTFPFVVIFPQNEITHAYYNKEQYVWRPVGTITKGTAAPAMRAAITNTLRLDGTPDEQAARALLLASFDETCRSLLGLDDNDIITPRA